MQWQLCCAHESPNTKKGPPRGPWGYHIFVYPNLIFFVTSNSVQNFITLGQPLLGEKYVAQKKERKIIPKIVDTSFCSNA